MDTWLFVYAVRNRRDDDEDGKGGGERDDGDIYGQFHQRSTYSFYACRSQKRKKTLTT